MTTSTRSARPTPPLRGRSEPEAAASAALRAYWGCRRIPMTRAEFEDYDGRVECWDAQSGAAMVLGEASMRHEIASQRLAGLVRLIGMARGAEILALGSTDLEEIDDDGERKLVLQADQTLYLHPDRGLPEPEYINVHADPLPDVVLEVDYTTNVWRGRSGKRGKLDDYIDWRLPEIWVEVPDASRWRGPAGLSIVVLERNRYVEAASSRAFPGWTAEQIHRALNETEDSPETLADTERVGRAMAAAEGRPPFSDPSARGAKDVGRAEGYAVGHVAGHAAGHAQGHAEGRAQGHAEGRGEGQADVLRAGIAEVLASRGIPISKPLAHWLSVLDAAPDAARAFRLAAACRNADDLLRQLRESEPPSR